MQVPAMALVLGLQAVACDRSPPPAPAPAESTGVTSAQSGETGTVRASGSSALQPLVNAAKEQFEARNKGISVEVSAGGSRKGLADVAAGAVQIGDSDIFAPDDLKAQLVDHKIAVVGFAAMANKGVGDKIAALTLQDLGRVFSGAVTNWKEVGGDPLPVVVINRAPGSGTRSVFGNIVLGGDKFVESQTEDNSGALVAKLKQTKGAISYLALSFKDDDLVTLSLKIGADVVDPTPANIAEGKYPIWSYEHMYTKGPSTGTSKQFIDFILSQDFQTHVLANVKGFIPITSMKIQRDKD
jgi:phosphate transport system substrate-binding protein